MEQTLFAFPILPGKTEAARAFLQEAGGPRKQENVACNQSLGITREVWALQQTAQGDLLIVYVTGEDLGHAFTEFAASQTEFDRWFKQRAQEVTGVDMYTPPAGPTNEILADTGA